MLRRGLFYNVCRKHCTKESGNPVLPCQAIVWVRSTRKHFVHLECRWILSKEKWGQQGLGKVHISLSKGDCRGPPETFHVSSPCIVPSDLYSWPSTAWGNSSFTALEGHYRAVHGAAKVLTSPTVLCIDPQHHFAKTHLEFCWPAGGIISEKPQINGSVSLFWYFHVCVHYCELNLNCGT